MEFIKIKNLCTSKDIIKKIKRQVTTSEKTFVIYKNYKSFVSRVYKIISIKQ